MESAQIGALMFSICFSATLLYASESPLRVLAIRASVKPFIMGTAVAVCTFLITRSRFGRRTGAHLNPSLTVTYFLFRRVHRWDALNYIVFQFAGAVAGVWVARWVLRDGLSMPPVRYAVTVPGNHGAAIALLSEFLLSGLLMGVVLFASNRKQLVSFSPLLVAFLTIGYYGFCSSLSGFSVNPARSFSSALFAFVWQGIWIYLAAPTLGMLAAASLYTQLVRPGRIYCAKVFHDVKSPCPFICDFKQLYFGEENRSAEAEPEWQTTDNNSSPIA